MLSVLLWFIRERSSTYCSTEYMIWFFWFIQRYNPAETFSLVWSDSQLPKHRLNRYSSSCQIFSYSILHFPSYETKLIGKCLRFSKGLTIVIFLKKTPACLQYSINNSNWEIVCFLLACTQQAKIIYHFDLIYLALP